MLLDIELEGWGNQIKSFSLDGNKISYNNNEQVAIIPTSSRGSHKMKIQLSPGSLPEQSLHKTTNYNSPATPSVTLLANGLLSWQPVKNAVKYKVMGNGN